MLATRSAPKVAELCVGESTTSPVRSSESIRLRSRHRHLGRSNHAPPYRRPMSGCGKFAQRAYFAYREAASPFDVVRGRNLGWLRRSLPGGRSGGWGFNSALLVSYRPTPGRILQAVGCLTCQVNRRQPFPRPVARLPRRFSCSSPISTFCSSCQACSNKGYYTVGSGEGEPPPR